MPSVALPFPARALPMPRAASRRLRPALGRWLRRRSAALAAAWLGVLVTRLPVNGAALDDLGPAYDRFPLTLEHGMRTEVLGPLFHREETETTRSWGITPFFSHRVNVDLDRKEYDFLYPVLTFDGTGAERRLQLFQLFNLTGGRRQTGTEPKRFSIFPFYFQQRSEKPEENYTALVPFYGQLRNRMFRDEVRFAMLPFWLQTRKKDVVTDNYVVPFYHTRRGNSLTGWQLWPIAGSEQKGVTSRTNVADEVEIVGGHDKRFVLWPFYFDQTVGIGTTNQLHQQVLLPFYSTQRSPARASTSILWPAGWLHTTDREKGYELRGMPWPFVVFAQGTGRNVRRVWPLFGETTTPTTTNRTIAWPLLRTSRIVSAPLDRSLTRVLFFGYRDLTERNMNTGTAYRRTDLWPLFTVRREHDGNERLQFFAPIEPLLPHNEGIEKTYAPAWSIWRSEKNARTGATSRSFLWNLYRHESTGQTKKCSLLFGLFQYQNEPAARRWRLFYLPVGGRSKPAQP